MMTTSSGTKKDLPPHWIVKTSRQYPSLCYYANVKTGQSTWKHPSLLKESELKNLTKKKDKKLRDDARVSDEEEQLLRPTKKGKFTPVSGETASRPSGDKQEVNAESPAGDKQELSTPSPLGIKLLKNDALTQKQITTKQDLNDKTESDKSKPVKFTIKKRSALFLLSKTDSPPKESVKLHPSILLAKKIVARESNVKKKVTDDEKKEERNLEEGPNAKQIKGSKETSTSGTDLPLSAKDSKSKEQKAKEIANKLLEDRQRYARRKAKRKRHKESIPVKKPTSDKEEKTEEKDESKETEEHQMYLDFISRKSYLWKKNRHDGSLKDETYNLDRDENEALPDKTSEEPKDKPRDSPKPVPYEDSPTVSKPVQETAEETIHPKVIAMEIDEKELNTEIANFRGSASYSRLSVSDGLNNSTAYHNTSSLYFVVDTNVLLGDIDFLQELKTCVVDGRECVVVVPYIALQEMDGLKKSASIGPACQMAIRWCNQHFEARHPRVQGQTYSNYRTTLENNRKASADDLVRDCCLLLSQDGLDVCLLTNDINLRNKALMSNLSAASAKDLKGKLRLLPPRHEAPSPRPPQPAPECGELPMKDVSLIEYKSEVVDAAEERPSRHQSTPSNSTSRKRKSDQKHDSLPSEDTILLERITTSLHHTLSNILEDVMREIYGDLWLSIIKHKPPWSLSEVFACWEKHWIAAMIDKFPSNMKEELEEINNLITAPHVNVQRLMNRVQDLYSYFDSYKKHIIPIHDSSDVVDMSEALSTPPCSTPPPCDSSAPPPPQSSGEINAGKMINQVGAHITHFVALVLTAFGIQHNLQYLPNMSCDPMTPDNARTSGINLHKVIMSLGTGIMRCLNERNSASLQELGHLLVNFWSEAHLPCPELPFMECDLKHLIENPNTEQYLKCVLQELESLVQQLTPVLAIL